jgi:hypothetical protein
MTWEERTDQLATSATLYKTGPVDDWSKELTVPTSVKDVTDKVEMHRKYHFNMAYQLSLHLALCQEDSPLYNALNQLFNFALIELRFAEIISLDHHLQNQLVVLDQEKKTLFVAALCLFRLRETIYTELTTKLGVKMSRVLETGDMPFANSGVKTLQDLIIGSIKYLMQTMDSSLRKFKSLESVLEKDFWETLTGQLGFVIHMMNRVIKAPENKMREPF